VASDIVPDGYSDIQQSWTLDDLADASSVIDMIEEARAAEEAAMKA